MRSLCSIEGCGRVANGGKGWCSMHLRRWRRNGDPLITVRPRTAPVCTVEGCLRKRASRDGLCATHRQRVARNGTTEEMPRPTAVSRFWAKVDLFGPVSSYRPDLGRCWIWTGTAAGRGYGKFSPGQSGKPVQAHRWLYEFVIGPIASGLDLDHLCRVTLCVRPSHMDPVTRSENIRRGYEARRAS